MPLSENEQRLLDQMERALLAEDPKFASTMRGAARRVGAGRRVGIGVVGVSVGLVLLVVGVAQQTTLVGVAGFVLMLAGLVYAVSGPRRSGPTGVVTAGGTVRPAAKPRRRASFMQRIENRWDQRRDDH